MSRYFSRAMLLSGPRTADLLRTLAERGEAYRDHALVWRLFPGHDGPRDFLFRADTAAGGRMVYYVVSSREPQPEPGLFDIQTKPYCPRLSAGQVLRFDLRANPTVSRRVGEGRSRRHDVLMDAKRSAVLSGAGTDSGPFDVATRWLMERAQGWGLDVSAGELSQSGYRQHRLRRKGGVIEYSSLDYQGIARVLDAQRLQRVLFEGVGHAKGFGCGLLLVKRFL
ncbi:type I-E CRISPR-associated protein Cas6/Cse3/CasE [Orrella sp. JC864]|uniref:type I-E CRISPR-associated protein Cas6/Cse3/CasE n=1 Tax=Orrella sp. JC864 TaxID=3120298 RepID=UPI00300823D4